MIYFDTAYILKCYINERGSEAVRALAREHERIACCAYGRLELHAAFHRNFRDGMIDRTYLNTVITQFELDEEDHLWDWLPLNRAVMNRVVEGFRAIPSSMFLRTGDAIHLCSAQANYAKEIYTNDRHMLQATHHFDLVGKNIIEEV